MVGRMDAPSETQTSEVLCSITTARISNDPQSEWRTAIEDTARLGISRFALFLTGLGAEERRECYRLLLSHRLRHEVAIPFVHARGDMHPDEYRFLIGEFGTERFNLHRSSERRHEHPLPDDLRSRIYIENAWRIREEDLLGFAGICLDFSHMEAVMYLKPDYYPQLEALLDAFPIGANHVSAFKLRPQPDLRRDRHFVSEPDDLDYLAGFPRRYFGRFVAIELTNPLEEQLSLKPKIERHLARP